MLFKKIALMLSITTGISSVSSMDMNRMRQQHPDIAPPPQGFVPAHPGAAGMVQGNNAFGALGPVPVIPPMGPVFVAIPHNPPAHGFIPFQPAMGMPGMAGGPYFPPAPQLPQNGHEDPLAPAMEAPAVPLIHMEGLEKELQWEEPTNQPKTKKRKNKKDDNPTPTKRQKIDALDLDFYPNESNEDILFKARGIDPNTPDQEISREDVRKYKASVLSRIYKGTLSLDSVHKDPKEALNILIILASGKFSNENLKIFAKSLVCFGNYYYGLIGRKTKDVKEYETEQLEFLGPIIEKAKKEKKDLNPFYILCYGMVCPSKHAHREIVKLAAKKGDPFAAYLSAYLNEKKKGASPKHTDEFNKMAADAGHAQSQFTLALDCLKKNDFRSFFEWIEKALNQNEPNAKILSQDPGFIIFKNIYKNSHKKDATNQKNLGLILMDKKLCNHILTFNGPSEFASKVSQDIKSAHKWLRKSANAENAEAAFYLAELYKLNPALRSTPEEALTKSKTLKEQALAGGFAPAEFSFGHEALLQGDYATAFNLIYSASNKGHRQAQILTQYPDFMILKSIFEGAINDIPDALMKLGQIYMGEDHAHAVLGKEHFKHSLLPKNIDKSIDLLQNAIHYGCHEAAFYLGLIYHKEAEHLNSDLAYEMFALAAHNGHIPSQNLCIEGALKKADMTSAFALYKLYESIKEKLYETNIDRIFEDQMDQSDNQVMEKPEATINNVDFIKLMDLFESAQHNPEAQLQMGKMLLPRAFLYRIGPSFLQMFSNPSTCRLIYPNIDVAKKYFESALQNNCLEAALFLGMIDHIGTNHSDPEMAKKMYTIAASTEDRVIQASAQFLLGEIALFEGEFDRAVNMYKSAADKGNSDALAIIKDREFRLLEAAFNFNDSILSEKIRKLVIHADFYYNAGSNNTKYNLKVKPNIEKALLCLTEAKRLLETLGITQVKKTYLAGLYAKLRKIYYESPNHKDPVKAREFLELGATFGDPNALYILGNALWKGNVDYGIEGIPVPPPAIINDEGVSVAPTKSVQQLEKEAKIRELFEKAANLEHIEALEAMVNSYFSGARLPGINKDNVLTLKYFTMLLKSLHKMPVKARFNRHLANYKNTLLPQIFSVNNINHPLTEMSLTDEQNEKLEKFQHISEICFVPTALADEALDQNLNREELACFVQDNCLFFKMKGKNNNKVQIYSDPCSPNFIKEENKVYINHEIYNMIYDNIMNLKEINRNTPAQGIKVFDEGLKAQFLHTVNAEFCSESYVTQLKSLMDCHWNLAGLFAKCDMPFKFGYDEGIKNKYENIYNILKNTFEFILPIFKNIDKPGFYITELLPLNEVLYTKLTNEPDLFPVEKTSNLLYPFNAYENLCLLLKATEDFKSLHEKNAPCINFLNEYKNADKATVQNILKGCGILKSAREIEHYNYINAVVNSAYSSPEQIEWTLKTLEDSQDYLNQDTIDFIIQMNHDLKDLLRNTESLRNSKFQLANPFLQSTQK